MLTMRNKYCSNCLSTQRFLVLGTCLVCERCSKRLELVVPADDKGPATPPAGALLVAWASRTEKREAI